MHITVFLFLLHKCGKLAQIGDSVTMEFMSCAISFEDKVGTLKNKCSQTQANQRPLQQEHYLLRLT